MRPRDLGRRVDRLEERLEDTVSLAELRDLLARLVLIALDFSTREEWADFLADLERTPLRRTLR